MGVGWHVIFGRRLVISEVNSCPPLVILVTILLI